MGVHCDIYKESWVHVIENQWPQNLKHLLFGPFQKSLQPCFGAVVGHFKKWYVCIHPISLWRKKEVPITLSLRVKKMRPMRNALLKVVVPDPTLQVLQAFNLFHYNVLLQNRTFELGVVEHFCSPSTWESETRRLKAWGQSGLHLKQNKTKRNKTKTKIECLVQKNLFNLF
jgi:hypothetical protein